MITPSQLHHTVILEQLHSLTLPQNSITPSWTSTLLTAVPIVRSGVVFVRGAEQYFALIVPAEDPFPQLFHVQLIKRIQLVIVTIFQVHSLLRDISTESVVQIADPKYVTGKISKTIINENL